MKKILRKILRKLTSIIVGLSLLAMAMPQTTQTAQATSAVTGTFGYGPILRDENGNKYVFPENEMKYMQIWLSHYGNKTLLADGSCVELQTIQGYRVNDKVAYCFEHGVVVKNAAKLNSKTLDDSLIESIYASAGKEYVLRNMSLCLFYGRQNGSSIEDLLNDPDDSSHPGLGFKAWRETQSTLNADSYNLDDWETATRQLVQECQQQFRTQTFDLTENGLKYETSWHGTKTTPINKTHYISPIKKQAAYDIYRYMVSLIKKHISFPAGLGSSNEETPTKIKLAYNEVSGLWESRLIPAKRYEISEMKVVKNKNDSFRDIKAELVNEHGKYYYKYTYDAGTGEPNFGKTFKVKRKIDGVAKQDDDLLIWECKDGNGGHLQAMATGSADTVERFVQFTKDMPTPEGEKPQPEYFPSIEIPVSKEDLNPGFDGDNGTPMGDANLSATYVLYKDGVETDRITLDEKGTTKSLLDVPVEFCKELNLVESGTKIHETELADHSGTEVHCNITPATITWSKTITYEVKEIRPDGRFIEPDSGTRKYVFEYTATTNDLRECIDYPENWSEINYTVKLIISEGKNTGTETVAGNFAAVKERDCITCNEETFVNDVYRGKLHIIKSLEEDDVFSEHAGGLGGGKPVSTASLWKIKLASGGYENHPYIKYVQEADLPDGTAVYRTVRDNSGTDCDERPVKPGSNGAILVTDIPYGEYIVEEFAADDLSFEKEQFTCVIDEHSGPYATENVYDNRYDYNVRDRKISNVIKLVKTDAETGKTVPAAGVKFYLRYMGNHLLAHPETSENYYRLLPNGQNISQKGPYTWETNENGEITVPYEMEFGLYRLEEWLLPKGYFVGEYDNEGCGHSHNYGMVEEGQRKALETSDFDDLVAIYDDDGNKVTYKDKEKYEINEVFNFYAFKIEKQETHIDGNFGQRVTYDGLRGPADQSYSSNDYPYPVYYKEVAMANNQAKGKIQIFKEGQMLIGFDKVNEEGFEVYKPVYGPSKLAGAVFGIYAAEDICLNDAADPPVFFDSRTDEPVEIPLVKSTYSGNLPELITSPLSKFFRGSAGVYDTGELEHESGAKLWYLNEREISEEGKNRLIYVSPEQKDTSYSYVYSVLEEGVLKTYDVHIQMNYQAGGKNTTNLEMTKISEVNNGYLPYIPITRPEGKVGETVLNPVESYLGMATPDDSADVSVFTVSNGEYRYESNGISGVDYEGNITDFSDIGVKKYSEKDYIFYRLTGEDIANETRITTPEVDDGDGIYDKPGEHGSVSETRKRFEWENDCTLLSTVAGEKAVMLIEGNCFIKTIGYYRDTVRTDIAQNIPSNMDGMPINTFNVPAGYNIVPYSGDIISESHYIIAEKIAGEDHSYIVLLENGQWQACDGNGNFLKRLVQVYEATYVQEKASEDGFYFSWDGFEISSNVDQENKMSMTDIKKQSRDIGPTIELGAGYSRSQSDMTDTFKGMAPESPVYVKNGKGTSAVITKMYYAGGVMRATLIIPESAIEKNWLKMCPSVSVGAEELLINWYSNLSPSNPEDSGTPLPSVRWTALRHESDRAGESESYVLDLTLTGNKNDAVKITFADGYTMSLYADTAENGSGVGIMELTGINRTVRYSASSPVETITTHSDGVAVSSNLPLGKYIVREISAPSGAGHVAETTGETALELKYKDQFTPLVWKNVKNKNSFMNVEIDVEKAFETAYGSGTYAYGGDALFGIYAAEEIAPAGGTAVEKDTLIDIISVGNSGLLREKIKLPMGKYYLKELRTKYGYGLLDVPFYFIVSDDGTDTPVNFTDDANGVVADVIMESYGTVNIIINVKNRYPAARLTIDGTEYVLDKDYVFSKGSIAKGSESGTADIILQNGETINLVLPGEKHITVTVQGNSYFYNLDGNEEIYMPKIINTGYYAECELEEKTENPPDAEIVFKGAADTAENRPVISILNKHYIRTQTDPETLMSVPVYDDSGEVLKDQKIEIDILRGVAEEIFLNNAAAELPAILFPKDVLRIKLSDGSVFGVLADEDGNIRTWCHNTIKSALTDENGPEMTINGIPTDSLKVYKNITLARQTSVSDCLQVKINTLDNMSSSPILNTMLNRENIPYMPDTPVRFETEEDKPRPSVHTVVVTEEQLPEIPKTPLTTAEKVHTSVPQTEDKADVYLFSFMSLISALLILLFEGLCYNTKKRHK